VLYFGLDLLDASSGDDSYSRDGLSGLFGNDAVLGENGAGGGLDLEPATVLGVFSPDAAHRRAGIAFDHERTP